ncbi:MAG: phosphate ABC transporter substrate-binding protein PstS [Thaumarchaeota archaeon]|nr:phosphate ABC transporter substrate-binding protein PstS [Nitrososphaerota archaeon]
MKKNSSTFGMRKAVSTTVVAVIIVVVIIAAAVGVYAALGTGKSTVTSTVTSTATSTTTAVSTITSTVTSGTVSTTSVTSTLSGPTLPTTLPSMTISETGSTLLYPLFQAWVPNFTSVYSGVKINTAGTGSGTGISNAASGTVQIGASDAYLLPSQMTQYPNLLNIPLAISAQQIFYNIPGIPSTMHLNFTGNVLAQIYNGTITNWNDAQIKAINPAASSLLPDHVITPIRRQDGSGDTFIFTTYLSDTNSWWNTNVGFATAVSWPPVSGEISAIGNGGMVTASQQNQYSIAYIGISFLSQALQANLNYAFLGNKAGNFVNATQANIAAAASQLTGNTPANEAISLVYAPGANSYPIINYEYAIVSKSQADANTALVVRTFLTWCLLPQYGNNYHFLNQVGFIQLPPGTVTLSLNQISQIGP